MNCLSNIIFFRFEGKTWSYRRRTSSPVSKRAAEIDWSWEQVKQVTTGKTTTVSAVNCEVPLTTRPRAAKGNWGAAAWGGGCDDFVVWVSMPFQNKLLIDFALLLCTGHGPEWVGRNRLSAKGECALKDVLLRLPFLDLE